MVDRLINLSDGGLEFPGRQVVVPGEAGFQIFQVSLDVGDIYVLFLHQGKLCLVFQ